MRLRKGMMLDFINLGQGLIVDVHKTYESTVGKHPYGALTDDRTILTNKYVLDVLVEGKLYPMDMVIHYEWEGDLCRIEWRIRQEEMFARSGLAEILWQTAKTI